MRHLLFLLLCVISTFACADIVSIHPAEDAQMILHNPDMGWVIYENYPIDSDPHGSSTMLTLPSENFPMVDQVAVMFSWADIEKKPDEYDFSRVDHAYDYWKKLGKEIQLRLSTETLLWWNTRNPPAGVGVPPYVLDQLPASAKQIRKFEGGLSYTTVDARQPIYLGRLAKFLQAVNAHFDKPRPITLIDLRGFGLWGEWHSGFRYPSVEARHKALCGILDVWSKSLNHPLALSYSYDPDSPPSYFAGPTDHFESRSTKTYDDFVHFSAFDHALTLPNITFRRDGVGGAVHSNERKLLEAAFAQGKGPMSCEFIGGYGESMKAGKKWVDHMMDDALSLHPNYITLLGWQGGDALEFCKHRPDLLKIGSLKMGYRLVPLEVKYPSSITVGKPFNIDMTWINRGFGRFIGPARLTFTLRQGGNIAATSSDGAVSANNWIAGYEFPLTANVQFDGVKPGHYELWLQLFNHENRPIELPLAGKNTAYRIGDIDLAN
jgi:Domain of unknown function (DUF4832)